MFYPSLPSPHSVKQAFHGLMQEDAATCGASINSMLKFFWQATENYQTMAKGTFLPDGDGFVSAYPEVVKSLQGATIITDCFMVDPLSIEIGDVVIHLDHRNIPCFMEKPDENNPRQSTRIYFNAVKQLFLAVGVEYKHKEAKPGPFSPGVESRFVRIRYVPKIDEEHIVETMHSLLATDEVEPLEFTRAYRPVH